MTGLTKDTRPLLSVIEISDSPDSRREHIDTLIEETDRLIAGAFSLADAKRNPKVERNLRMLSALQGVSYESTCATFGLPLSLAEKARVAPSTRPEVKKKPAKKKESTRKISIDYDRAVALIRLGKRPRDIARELKLEDSYAQKRLAVFLSNSGLTVSERQRIQREENPNIILLIEKIKNEATLHGYFAQHVFGLVNELQGMYDISLRQIAEEILLCDVQLLYAHRQIHK